jgi:hypothetical protein
MKNIELQSLAPKAKSKTSNEKQRVPSGLRKRDKLKLTLMWIFVMIDIVLILAIMIVVLLYEQTINNAATTEPMWLSYDVSPGVFDGCISLPPQLYGSFGPTQVYVWDPTTGQDKYYKQCPEGQPDENGMCEIGTVAKNWTIDEVIGTPNGATILKWNPDGYNAGLSSVECATAWGTWDLNYGWENGIIYNFTSREFVYFGHIWKRSLGPVDYLEFWEVSASDLSYHIDELRSAIEGFYPEYDGPGIDHWSAPAYATEEYPTRGIPLPPKNRWCWNYEDCNQMLFSTDQIKEMWDDGTMGATWNFMEQPETSTTNLCEDSTKCDPDFSSSPLQTVYS